VTRLRRAGTTALAVLVALGTAGYARVAGHTTPPDPPTTSSAVRVAVVGDSITEADSLDFDDGAIGTGSWAWRADGGDIRVVGGWAHAGATTADMVAAVQPLAADVLVLMAGSNDLDADVPVDRITDDLVTITAEAHVPRVVLSTVPPEDGYEEPSQELNQRLRSLARERGWDFVDAMAGVRNAEGGWRTGMSEDGVHPDDQGADLIGAALRAAILDRVAAPTAPAVPSTLVAPPGSTP
jgi:lysophospholipase L1-like esterase